MENEDKEPSPKYSIVSLNKMKCLLNTFIKRVNNSKILTAMESRCYRYTAESINLP